MDPSKTSAAQLGSKVIPNESKAGIVQAGQQNNTVPAQPPTLITTAAEQSVKAKADLNARTARGVATTVDKKPIKLDEELKESSILVFLDKGIAHKDQLDLNLRDRTKLDLERDKLRMKELMHRQKQEIIEMSQKRNQSAYRSTEGLGNAKTRKIEYLYDLSRNPVDMMKEKQQKEMEHMMNYEIALQSMRKQRDDFLKNKQEFMRGEQQYKEVVFEYNKKILEREKQLKEMQRKIDMKNKLYHVERTRKANEFERQKMVSKITKIDDRAKNMKEDRQDYLASRKFMVQKLKKDLENMKAGLMTSQQIETKYHFLHNDKEFQETMKELKRELNPGTRPTYLELFLRAKTNKNKRGGFNQNTSQEGSGLGASAVRSMSASPERPESVVGKGVAQVQPKESAKQLDSPGHPVDTKELKLKEASKGKPGSVMSNRPDFEDTDRIQKQKMAEHQQKQVGNIYSESRGA